MKRRVFVQVLAFTLVLWAQPSLAQPGTDSSRLTDLVEWVIELPFTEAQRTALGKVLTALSGERLQATAADADRLEATPAPQRLSLRPGLRQHLTGSNDALGQWIQQTESSARQVVVQGAPPLTQQALDSFCEWLVFAIDPSTPPEVSPAVKASLETSISQLYPEFSAEQQSRLASLPQQWASLRKSWPSLSSTQREQLRGQWKTALAPILGRKERLRVASAAVDSLSQALEKNPDSPALAQKIARIQFLSSGLRQEKDPECSRLADQLDMALFNIQQGQEQQEAMQRLNEVSRQIAERSHAPATDPTSLQPMFMLRGGLWVGGGGEGIPYRF